MKHEKVKKKSSEADKWTVKGTGSNNIARDRNDGKYRNLVVLLRQLAGPRWWRQG